ncbi:Histidine kinase domain protein [Gloeomargarita lithophora Alchichica-D10]|uniref:Oxygen sensor histidine kinase NreB n=1 Tax=Gloeomargarita lithophora Alchichica-D10 TaxID=1188229 RepID=A0A1J0AEC6_9CYAN|nr:Histidine kinase domain protein [Gloeomargarita lithophora Alchichica-D10]
MRLRHLSCSFPLPLLLWLEWLLLGVVLVVVSLSHLSPYPFGPPVWNELGVILFAAIGWVSPTSKWQKWFYTATQLGLIVLLALVGQIPVFQLLFIILVIRNCVLFQGRNRTLTTVLTLVTCAFCLWNRRVYPFHIEPNQFEVFWFGSLVIFGLVILFLQLFVDAVITERRSRDALAAANVRLQEYALKVEELATMQERNRIARDIHDSLGHSLTAFNFHLEAAIRLQKTKPTEAEALLLELKQLGAQTLAEVSQSVATLRTDPLGEKSLPEAITTLVDHFYRLTGVLPALDIHLAQPLPQAYNLAIFRIVQESLTNCCKYASTTAVTVLVQHCNQQIQITIADNGKGFDLQKNTTGFGLQGMRERVQALAGEIKIISAPEQGCRVEVCLPIKQ